MTRTLPLLPLALLLAAPPGLADERHPPVADPGPDACVACHAERTPGIARRWEAGPHGLALVKCFVCHGSTGSDFAEHPDVGRCEGCHPAEVASVRPSKGRRSRRAEGCFTCHEPHALAARAGAKNPHGAR